jgi:hypothetical protein
VNCAEIVNTTKSELLGCCIINMVLLQPACERCDRVKLSCRCCMQFIKLVCYPKCHCRKTSGIGYFIDIIG